MEQVTVESRFWGYVADTDPITGCRVYLRYKDPGGYGRFRISKAVEMVLAHRFAYTLTFGDIPVGMCVCHRCDNRACCNPDHLFLGTLADNIADMIAKGRDRKAAGERHWRAKLSPAETEEIRLLKGVKKQGDIAREFGVTQSHVSRIHRGVSWRSL